MIIFTVDCGSSSRPSSASLNSASPAGSTSHLTMGSTSHLPLGSTSHIPASIRSSQSSLSLLPTYDSLRSLASRVAACHICQADNNITCMVPEFVHSVAAYLSHSPQLRAYREMLIREPHLQNLLNIRMCIQDPSRALIKGGHIWFVILLGVTSQIHNITKFDLMLLKCGNYSCYSCLQFI